ncbi:MAG: hypothetical protein Q7R73_00775 [bacterium]|nr:hypothetical protein [bacterium]
MNGFLIYSGGIVSLLNMLYFAWRVGSGAVAPTNTASWLMWFLLDITALAIAIAERKPYALALSYAIGALSILLVHLFLGTWAWTSVEIFSAIGVVVSVALWQKLSGDWGIIACVSAMTIAGIPLTVMMWASPAPQTFWLFANTAIACGLTLLGTRPWTIGNSFLAWGGLVYNGAMALIVLR